MCLNAPKIVAASMGYKMWNTRLVADEVTPMWLAANVASVASGAPGGKLASLIFNCHGFVDGNVFVGLEIGTGIYLMDLNQFTRLKNLVDKIYLTVCAAARGPEGKTFCQKLASTTQASVIAGELDQTLPISIWAKLQVGEIDSFEGQVYEFSPAGGYKSISHM